MPASPEVLEPRRLMSAATAVTYGQYLGGTQVRVAGTDGDDSIVVRYDSTLGLVVTNTADGSAIAYGGTFKSVRVDGGAGNDSITIDWTVPGRTFLYGGDGNDSLTGGPATDYLSGGAGDNALDGREGDDVLVTVGGGVADRLTGGGGNDSFWCDAKRTEIVADVSADEIARGALHRVGSFFSRVKDPQARTALGNVSMTTTDLADPAIGDSTFAYSNFSDRPLFGELGPKPDDVNQGMLGDCYSMVVFSSVASLDPTRLRESVADLGDGTYVVQFRRGSAKVFARVDADLPVLPGTADPAGGPGAGGVPAYAGLGSNESIWVALMEKAHAVVRTAAGGYAGLEGGWMREVYALLGSKSKSFWTNSPGLLMQLIATLQANGRSVTFGTDQPPAGVPLLSAHAYTVVGVDFDAAGKPVALRLRNPWGVDGAGNDGSDDGYVTITPEQAVASLAGVCTAVV